MSYGSRSQSNPSQVHEMRNPPSQVQNWRNQEQGVFLRRDAVAYWPLRREMYNRGGVADWRTACRRLFKQRLYYGCLASLLFAALLMANVMVTYIILSASDMGHVHFMSGMQRGKEDMSQMPQGRIVVSEGVKLYKSFSRIGAFLPLVGLKYGAASNTTGRPEELRQIETLAIQGWRLTAEVLQTNSSESLELHIYGLVESTSHCNPAWDTIAGPHFECMALPARCLHADYANIPTINCILTTMAEMGRDSQYDHVVLANGDLLFPPYAFAALMGSIAQLHEQDIVVVGQRIDTTLENLGGHLLDDMEKAGQGLSLEAYVSMHDAAHAPGHGALLHPDFGVDYFIMSTSAVPVDFPPFLVGRFRWDNALLAHFVVATDNATVLDATTVLPVLHVGSFYSSDPEYHFNRSGAEYNDALAGQHFGESYKLGRIQNAAWCLQEARAWSQSHPPRYIVQPRAPRDRPDHSSLYAIARAGGGPLLLIPVLPHELMHALEWLKRVNQTQTSSSSSWIYVHYQFVALDRETYDALEVAVPGCTILEDMTGWPRPPIALGWKSFGRLVELRRVPVAILTATQLHGMGRGELDDYAKEAARCGAVVLRDTKELFSVHPQVRAGMRFWREYKAGGGWLVDMAAECWI